MTRVLNWMGGVVSLVDAQARWLLALMLLACGYAFAQPVMPDLGADPLGWLRMMASNPVALGLVVFGLVETWKRNAARREPPLNWQPWRWWTVAFVIGMTSSVALRFAAGLLPSGVPLTLADLPATLLNGVLAGVVAIAGRDGARTVLGWIWPGGAASTPAVVTPAAAPAGADVAAPPAAAFDEALQARGLLSLPASTALPAAALATLRAVLGDLLPQTLTREQAVALALRLAPIAPDLLDGSPYLSEPNRQRVLAVVQDLREEWGL